LGNTIAMNELRLVHTADVHLGHSSRAFGAAAAEHRRCLQEAFGRCIDLCLERQAHVLIVAGDLFDSPHPPESTVSVVQAQLSRLSQAQPPISCIILPGTHDLLKSGSIYDRWLAAGLGPRIDVLTAEQPLVHLADCDTMVWGPAPGQSGRPLVGLRPDPEARFNIAVVHGSVQIPGVVEDDEALITQQDIADSQMDYVALGHWHSFSDQSQGPVTALYCGSPEIVALDQASRGTALVVTIPTGGKANWEQVPTGRLKYNKQELNVADFAGQGEILAALLEEADPNKIVDIHLTGLVTPGQAIDSDELEIALADSFFRVRVTNDTHLPLEQLDESEYPPQLVAGRFVQLMKQRIEDAKQRDEGAVAQIAQQALQVGLALLEGREVLG